MKEAEGITNSHRLVHQINNDQDVRQPKKKKLNNLMNLAEKRKEINNEMMDETSKAS